MFPSVISTFNIVSASDRLNSPSHSALHNSVGSVVTQIETFIGKEGVNSTAGTLLYDVRSPDSNGGGHIQTANKGGTGQTTYTRGDLLVATSSSVISKLAVSSTTGEVLIADTAQAAGMRWGAGGAKVAINTTTSSIYNSNAEQVLFSASILGSTLGINNAIKFKGVMLVGRDTNGTFTLRAKYGENSILSILLPAQSTGDISSTLGFIEGVIVGHTSVATQKGFGEYYITQRGNEIQGDLTVGYTKSGGMAYGTASVNSSANQDLIITGQFSSAQVKNSVLGQLFVVEKIV